MCVAVIGWLWIIGGSAWGALSGFGMLCVACQHDLPLLASCLPWFVGSVVAVVSGINFLKHRPWSRTALEVLSWCLLAWFVGFGCCMVAEYSVPPIPDLLLLTLLPLGLYAVPLLAIIHRKSSSRAGLEVLGWLLGICLLGRICSWTSDPHMLLAVYAPLWPIGIGGVPVAVMVRYLRSARVKTAMNLLPDSGPCASMAEVHSAQPVAPEGRLIAGRPRVR